MRPPALALLAPLGGCIWLSEKADPDGDGVPTVEDCAPADPAVSGPRTFYADLDGDGYGDAAASVEACAAPEGAVEAAGDCDDDDAQTSPEAQEVCDGADQDCSGEADDLDADGDGASACAEDCDDERADVGPGEADACGDGLDAGCDGLPCALDLADADAVIYGSEASSTGSALLSLDLLEGAGADLVLSASEDDTNGEKAGAVYLIPGPLARGTATAASLARTTWVGAVGGEQGHRLGQSLASGWDIDGDGVLDLAMGAHKFMESRADQGAVYLALGPFPEGVVAVDDEEGGVDRRWRGESANDRAGYALALLDLDEDAEGELAIGAYGYKSGETDDLGAVYVLLDPLSGDWAGELADVDARLIGEEEGDGFGNRLAEVGDLDGDGRADLAVSCSSQDEGGEDAGAVYLYTEPPEGALDAGDAAAWKLTGSSPDGLAGSALSTAGDADGDGLAAVWVGGMNASEGGADAGAVWLVDPAALPAAGGPSLSLDDAPTRVLGSVGDVLGWSASGGRDADGDGELDLLVGARQNSEGGIEAGMAYLLPGPFEAGVLEAAALGARYRGPGASAYAGRPVLLGGDLGGEGQEALVVGASGGGAEGLSSGAVFVVFGYSY